MKPQKRIDGLIIRELADELLVYDLRNNKAHCLNHTAALIWNRCDGESTVEEIQRALSRELETSVDERVIWYALKQLDRDELLETSASIEGPFAVAHLNRRGMVRLLGLSAAAITLPLVTSIVAPTAVQAATCLSSGQPCSTASQCCSGLCSGTPLVCA